MTLIQERFTPTTTLADFRSKNGTGALDVARLVPVLVFEAMNDTSLRDVLMGKVYKDHSQVGVDEIVQIASALFTGDGLEKYVTPLRGDKCLGFADAEVTKLTRLCNSQPINVVEVLRTMEFQFNRFSLNNAFHIGDEWNYHGNMIPVLVYEAQLPGTNLRHFLNKMVFFNNGEINARDIAGFARALFLEAESSGYLRQLRRAGRLGYTTKDLRKILGLLRTIHVPGVDLEIAVAMGYPRPRLSYY